MNKHIKEGDIIFRGGRHLEDRYFLFILKKDKNFFDVMLDTGQIYYGQMLEDDWIIL